MDIPAKWGQSSEPAPKACDILECTVAHGKTAGFQDPCIVLGLGCGSPPDLKNLDPSLPQPLREARCIRCSRLPHQEENIAPMCYPLFTLVLSSFRRSFPSFLRCGRCLCRTFFICRLTGTGGGPALPPARCLWAGAGTNTGRGDCLSSGGPPRPVEYPSHGQRCPYLTDIRRRTVVAPTRTLFKIPDQGLGAQISHAPVSQCLIHRQYLARNRKGSLNRCSSFLGNGEIP